MHVKDNRQVMNYMLDPTKYYNPKPCRVPFGVVGGNDVSVSANNLVDIESELRNQTRIYSQCPQHKYVPACVKNNTVAKCGQNGLPCGDCLDVEQKLQHLPTCDANVNNKRVTDVGYKLNYTGCPHALPSSMAYKP
jgi:hypothetical protein